MRPQRPEPKERVQRAPQLAGGCPSDGEVAGATSRAMLVAPGQPHRVFLTAGANGARALRRADGQVAPPVDTRQADANDGQRSRALAPGRYGRVGIRDDRSHPTAHPTPGANFVSCYSERSEESTRANPASCASTWILRFAQDDTHRRIETRSCGTAVRDNGPGATPEIVARAVGAICATKVRSEGAGLGLSVVDGVVSQHGGGGASRGQPGRGVLSNVRAPAATSEAPEKSTSPVGLPRGGGQEILVVDDDDVVLSTARAILAQLGYRPCAFERAEAALAEFEARPTDFAAVFTDLTMPGMDGLQLTARIKALRPAQPVLLASGLFTDAEEREATRLRVARLVPKPFSVASLAAAVAECVREGQ